MQEAPARLGVGEGRTGAGTPLARIPGGTLAAGAANHVRIHFDATFTVLDQT